MQNFAIVQRSSLVYLAKAFVGTKSHVLLGVRFFIRKSLQEHLDSYARLSVAGVVLLLRNLETF